MDPMDAEAYAGMPEFQVEGDAASNPHAPSPHGNGGTGEHRGNKTASGIVTCDYNHMPR